VTRIVSTFKRTVGSLEESWLSSKKLSQMKYPKGKIQENQRSHEKKNIQFNTLQ
jgi:hypothetical protein